MFDVYLSFCVDIPQGFARTLYAALDQERILTFFDEGSLKEAVPAAMSRGIKKSRIYIPVFSKKIAESKWCLQEVSLMIKFGAKICPLFYDVLPRDLRCRDGSKYAECFRQQRLSADLILEYNSALETVSNLCGWSFDQYNSRDDNLIKDVVVNVRKILHSNSPHKVYPDISEYFGLDRPVEHVKRLLNAADHQQKMMKLGIHGMSGIGKTTLAKVVCKELFSEFAVFSFVPSVGERCQEADGLLKLQTQMLKDVSRFRGEVGHVDQGKGLLQDCLRGKRVLLVLDDIQSFEQFDALGGNYSDFGAGSRLIITSQNLQVLKVAKVDKVYQVRSLPPQHALRLFKFHAFPNFYRLDQELETICNDIVTACEGLPLALQIYAELLVDKENIDAWIEMVGKLRCEPNVLKKLRASYDVLDRNEKEMFQDIACFLTWTMKEIVMIFWAEVIRSPHVCLRSLLQKSFVDLGPGNELLMHRCFRDLGRSIAGGMCTETPERTRLFDEEDVPDVLCRLREKAKYVFYLSNKPKGAMTLKAEMFMSLSNLRLLWLTDVAIEGHFSVESSLEHLRWLRLIRYSSKRLPQGMNLQNLVILEVTDSQITHLWDETEKNLTMRPGKLKVLILRRCGLLESLPGTLCHTPLQILGLHNCHSLSSLPDSMGSWTSLVFLDMEGCSVSSLPQDFGRLARLKELNLSCCQHLSKLPTSFGNLTRLVKLEMHHSSKLTELPNCFGGLKTLTYLDIEGCSVSSLPQDFGKLGNLEELNLSCCQLLSKLPASFGNLTRLVKLEMHQNSKLTELPDSFGDLKTFTYLDIEGCSVSSLPQDFGKLESLDELNLSCCQYLSKLPASFENLKHLRRLDMSDCVELRKLPVSFEGLTCLKHLNLNGCSKLVVESDILENMTNLEYLNLSGCRQLEDLPHITNLASLTELCLLQTERLRELPVNIGQLTELKKMSIGSELLTSLPTSIGDLSSLTSLYINNCPNLQFLPGSLGLLEHLEIMFE